MKTGNYIGTHDSWSQVGVGGEQDDWEPELAGEFGAGELEDLKSFLDRQFGCLSHD